jgi:hypothetical protein
MIRNEIDDFRQRFFQNVIDTETQRQKEEQRKQAACFHLFNVLGPIAANGYQERTCSKCGLAAIKRLQVWEGTKVCAIS